MGELENEIDMWLPARLIQWIYSDCTQKIGYEFAHIIFESESDLRSRSANTVHVDIHKAKLGDVWPFFRVLLVHLGYLFPGNLTMMNKQDKNKVHHLKYEWMKKILLTLF